MKKLLALTTILVAFIFIGCEEEVTLEAPDVTFTVTDQGATLALSWDEITDADGYIIYADGEAIDTVTTTSYDATTPAKLYEVSAYAGDEESAKDQIDCSPEITTSLEVWDMSEPPPNPSGFGFNTAGTAVAYQVSDSSNWAYIDYYIESNPQQFWSPHHGNYNDEVNATKNSGGSDFDAADIADAPGGYLTQTDVASGAVYYFWIDPTNNGWDNATDNFGKIKVESVSGTKVTMKLAFQKIAGLRWCVTP